MNQKLSDQPKKSNPWKSAFVCLGAAIAGVAYGLSNMEALFNLIRAHRGASEAQLNVLVAPLFSNVLTVIAPILGVALIAGILNIVFVMKGGRKWPLIISSVGILISLGAIGVLAFIWMKIHGQS